MPVWDLVLEKRTHNQLNRDVVRRQLSLIAKVVSRNKSLGFEGRTGKLHDPKVIMDDTTHQEMYRYLVKLRIRKERSRSEEAAGRQFERIVRIVTSKAKAKGWDVLSDADKPVITISKEDGPGSPRNLAELVVPPRPEFVVPELTPEVMATFFNGVYEREAHIRTIHDGVRNYVETLRKNKTDPLVEVARSHVLLKGKPAGCKTTIYNRFKQWYEADGKAERVLFVDGPTMSKAGLENFLLDRAEDHSLPEILVIEEIEKQDPNNLLTLVSLMGSGYISKLNARVGHRREIANILVWATCNEEQIIEKFRNGVLWSRFVHKKHCVRPSQELMRRIMQDRVNQLGGNPRWVDCVMEYAYEIYPKVAGIPMDDPREIKGLLDGRDRLLDGSYQQDHIAILRAELAEKKADVESETASKL